MPHDPLIDVDGVSKKYCRSMRRSMQYALVDIARDLVGRKVCSSTLREDEFWVLRDIAFKVQPGECVGVIGPNGAGKSTLLKLLNGIMWPDVGAIRTRGRMGALIEVGAGFHPLLSGRENVYVGGAIMGLGRAEVKRKFDEIVAFAELEKFIDMPVKHYSSGMYVRLGFAVAASASPDVLLIDEVLAVGDLRFRHKSFNHIRKLADNGTAIVLVTHSMTDLLRLAQRTVVLEQGRLIYEGDTEGGVAAYQASLANGAVGGRNSGFGQLPLTFESVYTHDGDGIPRNDFVTTEDVWIDLTVRSSRVLEALEIRFELESPAYGPIATVSSLSSTIDVAFRIGEVRRIAVRLRKIPLLRGNYVFHVHIFDNSSGDYLGSQYGLVSFNIIRADLTAPHRHLLMMDRDWYVWNNDTQAYTIAPRASGPAQNQQAFHG